MNKMDERDEIKSGNKMINSFSSQIALLHCHNVSPQDQQYKALFQCDWRPQLVYAIFRSIISNQFHIRFSSFILLSLLIWCWFGADLDADLDARC